MPFQNPTFAREANTTPVGMYGKKTWGGPVDPFILVKFLSQGDSDEKDPTASMVIFEWKDRDLVGIPDPDGFGNVSYRPLSPHSHTRRLTSNPSVLRSATTSSSRTANATRSTLASSSCHPTQPRMPRAASSPRLSTSRTPTRSTSPSRRPDTTASSPTLGRPASTMLSSSSATPTASFPPLRFPSCLSMAP